MATTTNYSWTTPDDTDLVKDGAAAIRSLGTAIDSTVFTNAGAAIAKATIDAKGDLIAGTADNTVARLAVGANGTTLVADSSTATGLKWDTPASGGLTLINTGGTTLSGASVTLSSIPGTYKALKLVVVSPLMATDGTGFFVRVNADSNTRYANWMSGEAQNVTFADTQWVLLRSPDNTVDRSLGVMDFFDYANTTSWKMAYGYSIVPNATTTTNINHIFAGFGYNQTSAITSLVLSPGSGNFTSGTAYLYGVN